MAVDELIRRSDCGDDLDGVLVDARLLAIGVPHVDDERFSSLDGDPALSLEGHPLLIHNLISVAYHRLEKTACRKKPKTYLTD